MRTLILAVILAASARASFFGAMQEATCCTYFVDSVNGNNANNGRTPATAFADITSLPTLKRDQSVGLATASAWRQQLTSIVDHLMVTGYGSGALPILNAADILVNASFTQPRGAGTAWQQTVSPAFTVGDWVNVWENDVAVVRATSLANCDATANTYWVSADTGASITLYINPVGGTNPTSDGNLYEFSKRNSGLDFVGSNYDRVSRIRTQKNLTLIGSMLLGRYAYIVNSEAWDGNKHNAYVKDGAYVNGLLLNKAWYNTSASMLVYNEDTPVGAGITFNNVTARAATSGAAYLIHLGAITGMDGHSNISGNFGLVQYINCATYGIGTGYSVGFSSQSKVTNSASYDADFGVSDSSTVPVVIDGLTVAPGANVYQANNAIQTSVPATNVTANNVQFSSTKGASELYEAASGATSGTLTITNSAISGGNPTYALHSFYLTSITLTATGNDWSRASSWYYNFSAMVTPTITSNTNNFGAGARSFKLGTPTYTLTQWKALGYDSSSTP